MELQNKPIVLKYSYQNSKKNVINTIYASLSTH